MPMHRSLCQLSHSLSIARGVVICLLCMAASFTAADAGEDAVSALQASATNLSYGEDPRQVIDLWLPTEVAQPPLIVYVHGGAWRLGDRSRVAAKPAWALEAGWALASVEYRLTPQVRHPAHVEDIAAAVAWIQQHHQQLGVDPHRVALLGHSAGAHLVTFVGVDGQLRARAGIHDPGLRAVIALDGAGYDIPAIMASGNRQLRRIYSDAFGDDPAGWVAASPTHQIKPADHHPSFLLFSVAHREAATVAAAELARRLMEVGAQAQAVPIPNTTHAEINRSFGLADATTTALATAFLHEAFKPVASPTEEITNP